MNHVKAILWKQLKDTLKNKAVLIQFIMFPVMTVIMENAILIQGMQEHFFANLFAVMYVGMAPLTCIASIISEEKEKNTLRVLQMCNVKAFAYLLGNAIYIVSVCMLGSLVIGLAGGYKGFDLLTFILIFVYEVLLCDIAEKRVKKFFAPSRKFGTKTHKQKKFSAGPPAFPKNFFGHLSLPLTEQPVFA